MPKPIPDTRIPCGINDCTEMKENWRFACDDHMNRLPPGVRRLLTNESASLNQGKNRDSAWCLAFKCWNGEDASELRTPITLPPMSHPTRTRSMDL